jgi:hypothetical protein
MQLHDVVVGAVSSALGLFLLLGSIANSRWLMSLRRPSMLAESIGPRAARAVLGLIGAAMIAIGIAVALGWRVNWG